MMGLRDRRQARCGDRGRKVALLGIVAVLLGSTGCKRASEEAPDEDLPTAATVKVTRPKQRTFHRLIEQPARVEAFEETSIHAMISGYVEEVTLQIGRRVHKGNLLARLKVPHQAKELKQKKELVGLAEKSLAVAEARIATARAQVLEAEASLPRTEAARDYWKSQSERFTKLVQGSSVMDRQTEQEALNQYRSASAGVKESLARIASARAAVNEMESLRDRAEADVRVARAEQERVAALLSYTEIRSPIDGIISHRHVDTGDFLQPAASGTTGKAKPLFVVVRTDRVRVFLDVPEADAVLIRDGMPATIRIPVLNDREFTGTVAGSSFSLQPGERTLRTEVDFDNPRELLRPGMYAHASIPAQQDVLSVPSSAVVIRDGQTFCYCLEDNKAVKTIIRIGEREGQVVEVLKKLVPPPRPGEKARWQDFTGKEKVIVTNPAELSDGQAVVLDEGVQP